MKRVVLKELGWRDYRGQTNVMKFADGVNVVRGSNGTGKSTMLNAFLWLNTLCDADGFASKDLYDRNIPFTPENAMTASVWEVLDVDGTECKFKRTAKQKWVRKRGEAVFEKDKSDEYMYYVDDLAVSAKTYKESVESVLAPISKLKLMLNIRHYQTMDWKELRQHFSDMVGVVSDSELKGDYSLIKELLATHKGDMDKVKKHLRQFINPLEGKAAEIQSNIDGAKSVLPDISGVAEAKAQADRIRERIRAVDEEILGLGDKNKPYIEKREAELASISMKELEISKDRDRYVAEQAKPMLELESQLRDIQKENAIISVFNRSVERDRRNLEYQIKTAEQQAEIFEESLVRLRASKAEIKSRVFDGSCPACGRELPEDMVAEKRSAFYDKREKDLAAVCDKGVRTAALKEEQLKMKAGLEDRLSQLPQAKPLLDCAQISAAITEMRMLLTPYENTDRYKSLREEVESMKSSLTEIPAADASVLAAEKENLQAELGAKMQIVAREGIHSRGQEEIQRMEKELATVTAELAKYETQLARLIDREREWASIVRDRANRYLTICRVEMTSLNKDGSLADVCTVTVDGVDANGTINTANKIRAGIDISSAFQKNLGVCLPMFIDNAEQITDNNIPSVENQTIRAYVDDAYDHLTLMAI